MTDKFEFKRQKDSIDSQQKLKYRTKPSLLQYKQVIIELNETLQLLSIENEQLKVQKQKNVQISNNLQNKLSIQSNNLSSLIQKQKSWRQQKLLLNNMIKSHEEQQSKKDLKIKSLEQQIRQLNEKIRVYVDKISNLQNLNQVNLQKIRILEEAMQKLIEQNHNIRVETENVKKYNTDQMMELKQFSQQVTRKFKLMAVQLDHKQPTSQYQNGKGFDQKLYDLKQKRCFSTEKKQKRNVGCLSVTTNNRKGTSRVRPITPFLTQNEYLSPIEPIFNPELGHELKNLKKQIAHQYTLINMKNQAYSKERVNKALDQLKRKMGRVIQVAENSQQESFF